MEFQCDTGVHDSNPQHITNHSTEANQICTVSFCMTGRFAPAIYCYILLFIIMISKAHLYQSIIMKRKFKLLWSSISPISAKRPITSHLNWTHWTQEAHDKWRWKSRSWLGTGTTIWQG